MNLLLSLLITIFTCQEAVFIPESEYCEFRPGTSEWYTFSTSEATTVSIITAGFEDGKMELYQGTCDSLVLIGADDNSGPFLMPQIQFDTEANVQYFVRVFDVNVFEICVLTCAPLPVDLISYKLYQYDNIVTLKWSVGSETNNRMFQIYKSKDAISWEILGQIPGAGNSSFVTYYTYYDYHKWDGELTYYKLIQVDFNGSSTTLGILPLFSKKETKKLLKEVDLTGKPITKDYNGVRIKIYSNGIVEKVIYE